MLKFLWKIFTFCALFAATMGIGLGIYVTALLPNLPSVEEIRRIPLSFPLRVYSADNQLIAEYGDERRIPLALDDAPPLLIDAILATEDDRFYHHTGVDFRGLVRAAMSNIITGTRGQGASTVTMQVARNVFLTPEKTYTRKFNEILLAFKMEQAMTKDEILELYLNKIFLGHRAYGFAAAAQVYYADDLNNLSLPELAMLAGLPKAPSRDNPLVNPQRAKERRAYVLRRLYELGKIDALSYEVAKNAPITAHQHIAAVDLKAPYVSEIARQILYNQLGDKAYTSGLNVTVSVNSDYQRKADEALRQGIFAYSERHGYRGRAGRIELAQLDANPNALPQALQPWPVSRELQPALVTAADAAGFYGISGKNQCFRVAFADMQWAQPYIATNRKGPIPERATDVVSPGDVVYVRQLEQKWVLSQMPKISGGLVSMDPQSGAIYALTGGFDYYLSKFNRATQALRQPGSNIKPFIYSAALDHGFTPSSLVSAAPVVIEDGLEGVWRPQNYSKKFFGPTRLREALSLSLNLVSVRLLRAMGVDNTVEYLARFGFDPDQIPHNLPLALGSMQVTPLDMATGFAVMANGGHRVSPYLIERITDADGMPVRLPPCDECDQALIGPEALADIDTPTTDTPPPDDNRVISPQNAFLMTNMLKQVIRSGSGRRAQVLKRDDIAGKTGTTNDFKDAWFSGYNPDVVTTVYVGFDEPAHLGSRESGAIAALPIWIDYMGRVLQDFPEQPEQIPQQITTRFINRETAQATSADDPDGYTEYYESGSAPPALVGNPSGNPGPARAQESVTETLF